MNKLRDAIGVIHPCVSSLQASDSSYSVRIACLVPSITELLFDLNLGDYLVARTGFCIHPADQVARIPKVGGTKTVNLKKLARLAPTHVIVNMDENTKACADQLRAFVPNVIITHPITFLDNIYLYQLLGAIFDRSNEAHCLVENLTASLEAVRYHPTNRSIAVLYLIWQDPWMTISSQTYIADVLAHVGLKSVELHDANGAPSETRYPSFDWLKLDWSAVDAVMLSTEPFQFKQNDADYMQQRLIEQTGRQIPVLLVDGEMTSWYGSRAIKSLPYLDGIRTTIVQRLAV